MRFITFAVVVLAVACAPAVDPKVEEAVVAFEKLAAEAVPGDCAALKASVDAAHAAEGLKGLDAASPAGVRVKTAVAKIEPLLAACAEEAKKAEEAAKAAEVAVPVAGPEVAAPEAAVPAQ